jgi:hypothetical protein
MDVQELQEQVKMIQDNDSQSQTSLAGNPKAEFLFDVSLELPLAINLYKFLKGRSFIDKKQCLNDHCAQQFHCQTINYFSENKLVLHKSDNEVQEKCNKCRIMRNCAIYQCKICEFKACYYCLIDFSKRRLIQNITGVKEDEVKTTRRP